MPVRYCPRCWETLHNDSTTKGRARKGAPVGSRLAYDDTRLEEEKKKRGPSAYNRKYKAEYARQKKKHPRSKMPALAKKTHAALRRGKK